MAQEMKRQTIEKYKIKAPEFVRWLEENIDEGLTVFQFPREHRIKIRTSNLSFGFRSSALTQPHAYLD